GERLIAGAGQVERARADEDDRRLRITKSNLRPPKRLCQSVAGTVGAAVGFGDRAAVQPLERVGAEELQVLLALAHAVSSTQRDAATLREAADGGGHTIRRWLQYRRQRSPSCGNGWAPSRGRSFSTSGSPGNS